MIQTDVAIIGAGLAGLSLARLLHEGGRDFRLFEARDRIGGRIRSVPHDDVAFDVGAAWFWSHQTRTNALAEEFGLRIFAQHCDGDQMFEDEWGQVLVGDGFASMEGALRLAGGAAGLIDGLAQRIPADRLHLGAAVNTVALEGGARLEDGRAIDARHFVVATPPRIAAQMQFSPALDPGQQQALQDVPTWMGGHAKFVAVYEEPFWREKGLSGDVFSQRGPLAEIHDASGPSGKPAALFGFVGATADSRESDALTAAALEQLTRLFGERASQPIQTMYQDWAAESATSTPEDRTPLGTHPAYGLPAELRAVWRGRIHFASSEMAMDEGGLMEGALARAEDIADLLLA